MQGAKYTCRVNKPDVSGVSLRQGLGQDSRGSVFSRWRHTQSHTSTQRQQWARRPVRGTVQRGEPERTVSTGEGRVQAATQRHSSQRAAGPVVGTAHVMSSGRGADGNTATQHDVTGQLTGGSGRGPTERAAGETGRKWGTRRKVKQIKKETENVKYRSSERKSRGIQGNG